MIAEHGTAVWPRSITSHANAIFAVGLALPVSVGGRVVFVRGPSFACSLLSN